MSAPKRRSMHAARWRIVRGGSITPITIATGTTPECRQRYTGAFLGLSARQLLDALHFLSAGAVSLRAD